ncbi:Trans-2-enoyl-CoA reductase, mitochondrial, partial [Smittium mucronatum]
KVEVGDWVIPLDFGSYGSWSSKLFLNPLGVLVVKNKDGLTPGGISSTKVNALTAYRMLLDIVKLEKGDYVIQNGANSGVGQYLIQFARLFGYRTINVIRDRANYHETVSFLKGLGADIIVKDSDLETDALIEQFSHLDAPIKLAINCIGGIASQKLASHLNYGGTMSTYGAITSDPVSLPAPSFMFKNIKLRGYWLNEFFVENPVSEIMETWNHIFDLMRTGEIQPQATEFIDVFTKSDGKTQIVGLEEFKRKAIQAVNSKVKVGLRFTEI